MNNGVEKDRRVTAFLRHTRGFVPKFRKGISAICSTCYVEPPCVFLVWASQDKAPQCYINFMVVLIFQSDWTIDCRQLYTVRDGGTIALDWLLASDLEGSADFG